MKRIFAFILFVSLIFSMTACTNADNQADDTPDTTQSTTTQPSSEEGDATGTTNKQSSGGTHMEYVETYYVSAEKGAVITWQDPKTGEYSYKGKCEYCGETENSNHTNHRSNLLSNYCCINSKCSMWGKGQPVRITVRSEGTYVEVEN